MNLPFLKLSGDDARFVIRDRLVGRLGEWVPKHLHHVVGFLIDVTAQNKGLVFLWLAANVGAGLLEGVSLGILYLAVGLLIGDVAEGAQDKVGMLGDVLDWLSGFMAPGSLFIALIVLVAVAQVFQSLLSFAGFAISGGIRMRVRQGIMRSMMRQIVAVSFAEISRYRSGELWTHMTNAKGLEKMIGEMNSLVYGVIMALSYCTIMIALSWEMVLAAVVIVGGLSLGIRGVMRKIKQTAANLLKAIQSLNNSTADYLSGVRLIRSFGVEMESENVIGNKIDRSSELTLRGTVLRAMISPLVDVVTYVTLAAALLTIFLVLGEGFQAILPTILIFIIVLARLMPRLGLLNSLRASLHDLWPIVDHTVEFLRTDNKDMALVGGKPFNELKEGIRFENVSLNYIAGERAAVSNLSFTLKPGESLALVGESGAGKSSVVDLLLGLYEPTGGEILIDGAPLKDIDQREWRQRLGVVGQDTFLFAASVHDNIAFSKPDATDGEIIDAARVAHADEFISQLDKGYDTVLGDRGFRLSGGQRQRLALARAILRGPEILILDEATSDLDSQSEKYIQEALEQFGKEKTVISIAHRLSTVMKADRILVLDHGCLVEEGRHEGLVNSGGIYARLWKLHSGHDEGKTENAAPPNN
jgi:ATP-binding cassette subfamily B protein/subfamily B ATP-binding cassette protein MsbA